MKSGLVALAGRPNVGKSTLLNALLGQKLAIVSDKPQTTRSVVRGVLHRPEGQVVLVDTPGLHKPRTLLGQRLNDLVRGTLSEVDLILMLVDAAAGVGPGDRFLAG
ncbi:MAG TPA: GTPase, partial [Actinomycetes bacterium]|nr:GTPase [Actinomycetes bacterium]